jgi:hypothetical protein
MLTMNKIRTPAATKTCAAIASGIFLGFETDASRSIDVNTRSIQKPWKESASSRPQNTIMNTEYEKVCQKLVPSCSVLLKYLHVYPRSYHKEDHENCLGWDIDTLHCGSA